ncbi:hypothetical protein [Octadecabacter temperatus]|nr:hypothetical protein [Octadecabacter temperatus]
MEQIYTAEGACRGDGVSQSWGGGEVTHRNPMFGMPSNPPLSLLIKSNIFCLRNDGNRCVVLSWQLSWANNMQSIFYDLLNLPDGELASTEVSAVSFDGQERFTLVFEYWPDVYEFSGDKSKLVITASGANIKDELEADFIIGYSVEDILANKERTVLQINTGIRAIHLACEKIYFSTT